MKKNIIISSVVLLLIIGGGFIVYHYDKIFKPKWEIVDELDGNIFPSIVLSLATTNLSLIQPVDTAYLGNSKSGFAVKLENSKSDSKLRIELEESPFYNATVTEFTLKEQGKTYIVYPNVTWKYDALLENEQPKPVDISMKVFINDESLGSDSRTFSVRSIYECLLGYRDENRKYHDTGIFFAAYVNEDHPMIDKVLREALDAKIVKSFQGYQGKNPKNVKNQVYAIWYALQKRNFKYSSISKTSLSSDMLFSQRVRTVGNSLESSQINCIDGSVLLASFLRAINIDPIIVRIPGHVFMGFYLDKEHTQKMFLETTFIGKIDLDDYIDQFDEALIYEKDSLKTDSITGKIVEIENDTIAVDTIENPEEKSKTQNEISKENFEFAIENAQKRYEKYEEYFGQNKPNYMYLEINNDIRKVIQPIAK